MQETDSTSQAWRHARRMPWCTPRSPRFKVPVLALLCSVATYGSADYEKNRFGVAKQNLPPTRSEKLQEITRASFTLADDFAANRTVAEVQKNSRSVRSAITTLRAGGSKGGSSAKLADYEAVQAQLAQAHDAVTTIVADVWNYAAFSDAEAAKAQSGRAGVSKSARLGAYAASARTALTALREATSQLEAVAERGTDTQLGELVVFLRTEEEHLDRAIKFCEDQA